MLRCLLNLVFALALGVVGCSETSGTGGDGGSGGIGGAGGIGGGGSGGDPIVACLPTEDRCYNGTTEPHERCCEQTVPDQANACDGTESTQNPTTCTATGDTVTHRLTLMEIEDDCNVGYDLDDCEGQSCRDQTGVPPADGVSGVDNALASLVPRFEAVGANLSHVNKMLSDALCGLTDSREAGTECLRKIPPAEIRFAIDANAGERCANVTVLAGGEASAHILNLSEDGCASGTLGTIPITLFGISESFTNSVVRMTVSAAGFSDGLLGATIDGNFAWVIVTASLGPGSACDGLCVPLDINASTPPTQDPSAACNGLSATLRIGGVVE
jgi:hypothetical protein